MTDLAPRPWQPCNVLYPRLARALGELAPDAEWPGVQEAAADRDAPNPVEVAGLLWRAHPGFSFLATHRRLVQDQPPPPPPAWYGAPTAPGTAPAPVYVEDLEGRCPLLDPEGHLAGVPTGVVAALRVRPDDAQPGALVLCAPPRFPGRQWRLEAADAAPPVAGSGGPAVAVVATGQRARANPPAGGPLLVVGDLDAQRLALLPPGAGLVPGLRDPCGCSGFPRAPLPAALFAPTAPAGTRFLPSPHHDAALGLFVMSGEVVDDLERALPPAPPGGRMRRRAELLARAALEWRVLAPTAGDTLPCPTRRLDDATRPPWPATGPPPRALVLGPPDAPDAAGEAGAAVVAVGPAGERVWAVALGAQDAGLLRLGPDGAPEWAWVSP